MLNNSEDKHINKNNVDINSSNTKKSTDNFVFPKQSSETKEAVDKAEKIITESVESFARALDSTSPWLTKELLDIFDNVKKIGWIDETKLWETSFNLLYEKNADKIPDKIRLILKEMLDSLSQYNCVKNRSRTLEEMLRACSSIGTSSKMSNNTYIGNERTFMPWNLGSRKSS